MCICIHASDRQLPACPCLAAWFILICTWTKIYVWFCQYQSIDISENAECFGWEDHLRNDLQCPEWDVCLTLVWYCIAVLRWFCRIAKNRDINHLLYFTLLYFTLLYSLQLNFSCNRWTMTGKERANKMLMEQLSAGDWQLFCCDSFLLCRITVAELRCCQRPVLSVFAGDWLVEDSVKDSRVDPCSLLTFTIIFPYYLQTGFLSSSPSSTFLRHFSHVQTTFFRISPSSNLTNQKVSIISKFRSQ